MKRRSRKPDIASSGKSAEKDPFEILKPHPGPLGRIRNYFLAGVLVTAPIAITIWLTWEFIAFVDDSVRPLVPRQWDPSTYLPFSVPGLGVLLVVVFLILVGMLAAGFVGRMVVRQGERVLARVPVVRSIYSATKQIFETVLAQRSQAFRQVALVEYPSRGTWAIGFVTGSTEGEVQRVTEGSVVSVFVPATPNPTTGFLLFLPKDEVRLLDLSVEQGLKLVVSGGIVVPSDEDRPTALAMAALEQQKAAAKKGGKPRISLLRRVRNYFLAGILVTAPISITFWLASRFLNFVDARITPLIPPQWNPETYLPFGVPGLGLVVVVIVLTLVGMFAAGMVGRSIMRTSEWVLARLPVVRSIYGALKQIMQTIMAQKSDAFRECVLLQYPRKGSWAIGFITGQTEGHVQSLTERRVVNIFMPTTPNPTSGFLLFVPGDELIHLTMTVEEGLKMVVSGGIVVPPDRGAPGYEERQRQRAEDPDSDPDDFGHAVRRLAEGN